MADMKLFHWERMDSLRQYSTGNMIVMAENVEQARRIAVENFLHYLKTDESAPKHYMFELYGDIENFDEDDKEEMRTLIEEFTQDIQAMPTVKVERPIVFIQGSS